MIVITGLIFTDRENFQPLLARLKEVCEPSRAEEGNVFYHMGIEDAENCTIMAMEGWKDMAALQEHLALPDVAKLLSDFEGKFTNDVQIHEVSATQQF
jgi:quinol monooxygenase YgiN